jgi:hypothetical protein
MYLCKVLHLTKDSICKFADLRFAELICGRLIAGSLISYLFFPFPCLQIFLILIYTVYVI